ncbi:MAG: ligase [Chloroflexi bacterium OHK40]
MSHETEIWRLLPFSELPPAEELAAAEAMLAGLAHAPRPGLRWYGARSLALVLGSGQRPTEADGPALTATGVTLHKRASGGTAVLFAPGFLMQDIALPATHPLRRDDVSESYRWLGELWAEALAELGIPTELVSIPAARADTQTTDPRVRLACFGGRSPYELLAAGRKLVGFSQIRRRHGALFQAGLYAHWPGRELAALLRMPQPAREAADREALAEALARRVVGLDELLPTPPAPDAIMAAFDRALARRHGVALTPDAWSAEELAVAAGAASRYGPIAIPATPAPAPTS